jgi:uncharacterized protein YegP (UPF0339 family)
MRVRLYKKTKDNLSYFQFLADDDQAILNSQGYADKDDRNNGVRSVVNNSSVASRYERLVSEEGKNYFILKAANGQEIARSVDFDSTEALEAAIAICMKEIPVLVAEQEGEGQPKAAEESTYTGRDGDDNYKRLSFYQERIKGVENGFDSFATDEGNFYFTLNMGGRIVLLSESYTSQDGRNNGANAVTRNLPNPDRYQRLVHSNGKHYFNLLAGNNQQIATSVWFDTEAEMEAAIRALQAGRFGGVEEVILKEAGEGVTGEIEGMTGYRAAIEIATVPAPRDVEPKAKKKRKKREHKEKTGDEKVYLTSGDYLFNQITYQTMRSGNGKYYFSFRTHEGKALFFNANVQGFDTEEAVDAAVARVLEIGPYEGNYEGKTTRNGKYYFYLKDAGGKLVGKSFFYDSAEDMQDAVGLLIGRARVAAAAAPAGIAATGGIKDDYLPCERYAGEAGFHRFFNGDDESWYFGYNDQNGNTILRSEAYKSEAARDNGIESVKKNAPIEERWVKKQTDEGQYYFSLRAGNNQEIARTCYHDSEDALLGVLRSAVGPLYTPPPKVREALAPLVVLDDYLPCEAYAGEAQDGFRRFTEDGKFYFSYNDKDGNPILRSEAYKSEAARENGIESVKKNMPIKERWVKDKTVDGKYYYALRAGNNQEIARSCYHENEGAMLAAWGLLPALFFLPAAAKAVSAPPPPVVEKPRAAVVPPPPPVAASSGGFKWWWLLPLLLLIPLLFFLLRGCDGCKSTPPPAEEAVVVPPAPVDTVKKEPVPVTPAAPVCACKGSENAIFNIPDAGTPKVLHRLGTNPEFGNSHDLNSQGFYDKLTRHYKRSDVDKRFLENLFKAMGYANGFADAKADMITEAMVPSGTTGNMGYSPQHRTIYAQLSPDAERDRMAFRIKAANGCDIHFMKTCGNHFFFCPK